MSNTFVVASFLVALSILVANVYVLLPALLELSDDLAGAPSDSEPCSHTFRDTQNGVAALE